MKTPILRSDWVFAQFTFAKDYGLCFFFGSPGLGIGTCFQIGGPIWWRPKLFKEYRFRGWHAGVCGWLGIAFHLHIAKV